MLMTRFVGRFAVTVIGLIGLVGGVGGCSPMHHDSFAQLDRGDRSNVSERYPLTAALQRTKLDVAGFRGHGTESSEAYFKTLRFVRAYAQEGRGPLHVATPSHGSRPDVTMVRRVIRATGLHDEQVKFSARRDGVHAVTLTYDRVAAVGPEDCYDQSPLTERQVLGESGTGFGCATQKNLARMIADPADLVVAAPEADRGSERRAVQYKDYKETIRKPKGE
jgi:pilus assembly protein CpaD